MVRDIAPCIVLCTKVFILTVSRPARDAWIETRLTLSANVASRSRVPHGTRGLKRIHRPMLNASAGRVPHGTRGLKPTRLDRRVQILAVSRPARDAWIETRRIRAIERRDCRRVPHGTRGLKHQLCRSRLTNANSRVPHGTRGLKQSDRPLRVTC